MMKFVFAILVLMMAVPVAHADDKTMYVIGNGKSPDLRTQAQIEKARREALKAQAEFYDKRVIYYNGDEGIYIGRNVNRRHYNDYIPNADINAACSGLRERKYKRCVEDANEAREKLLKKYKD